MNQAESSREQLRHDPPSGVFGPILPGLLSHARRRGAINVEDAEDAVQEAICRSLERDMSGDALTRWLYVVTRNLVVDRHRGQKRLQDPASRRDQDVLTSDPLMEEIEDADVARSIQQIVQRLPGLQREVLQAVCSGRTVAEFALARGISVRAAEGHLRRARKVVRRRLAA